MIGVSIALFVVAGEGLSPKLLPGSTGPRADGGPDNEGRVGRK